MNRDLFDKKISESLEQNENRLPPFTNKEIVWENIENKLQKSRRIKSVRYAVLLAAACVAPIVCFTFLYREEKIKENRTEMTQIDSQPTDLQEFNQTIDESEQLIAKADSDFTVYEENSVKKNTKKNSVATDPVKEENPVVVALVPVVDSAGADLQSVPSHEVRENIEDRVFEPNNLLAATSGNDIKVRVSLSPGKQQKEKNEKIKIRFSTVFFTDNENKTSEKNDEATRMPTGLIRIPL